MLVLIRVVVACTVVAHVDFLVACLYVNCSFCRIFGTNLFQACLSWNRLMSRMMIHHLCMWQLGLEGCICRIQYVLQSTCILHSTSLFLPSSTSQRKLPYYCVSMLLLVVAAFFHNNIVELLNFFVCHEICWLILCPSLWQLSEELDFLLES